MTTTETRPRTILEYLMRQRDRTHEELCAEFAALAANLGEDATLSPRHLRRLASGERASAGPQTRRVMQELFGYPMHVLLRLWDDETEAEYGGELFASIPGVVQRQATQAIQQTLIRIASRPGTVDLVDAVRQPLTDEVLAAWEQRQQRSSSKPHLSLIAGFAGSGKSEFARFLSSITGWTILDKDTITRPLTEALLVALDHQPNDRESEVYRQQVRPREYACLMNSAYENLQNGVSTILAAPFVSEVCDKAWLQRLLNRCSSLGATASVSWVHCDAESMHEYLLSRGAARDAWKLGHWDEWLASVDFGVRPACDHFLVDNHLNGAVTLADQAAALVRRVAP